MKLPRTVLYALAFILILVLILGGALLYQSLTASTSGEPRPDSGIFGSLFPFGSGGIFGNGSGNSAEPEGDSSGGGDAPVVRKVTNEEVAGATFAAGLQGGLAIRYVERYTGHLYETPADSLTLVRLTNTTIPAVREALWINASSTVLRFLSDSGSIDNFVGSFATTTTDQGLQGIFLKQYDRVAIGPTGVLLGLTKTPTGSTIETVKDDGSNPRVLITSSLRSWQPYAAGNRFYLASAPSFLARGALYDITDGTLSPVISGGNGFQVLLSPTGSGALVSEGAQNVFSLRAVTLKTGVSTTLARATLVDKCVWSRTESQVVYCAVPKSIPQGAYPDDWLLGRVHTADDVWKINTETGVANVVIELEPSTNEPIDADRLVLAPDDSYLLFINRNDQSLWSLQLSAASR